MTTHITKTWFDGKNIVTQDWENHCKTNEADMHFEDFPDGFYLVQKKGKYLSYKQYAAGPEGFYGLPQESVSTPNAGGKCVTAGETAPIKEIDPNQWAFDRGLEST